MNKLISTNPVSWVSPGLLLTVVWSLLSAVALASCGEGATTRAATTALTTSSVPTIASTPISSFTPMPTLFPTPQPSATPTTADSVANPGSLEDPSSLTIEELIDATRWQDWKARWDAVNELGVRGDPRGLPALAERALHDDNTHPRARSLWAVSAIDQDAVEAIPLFLYALDDLDPVVVRNAAVALAYFKHEAALPELLRALSDPDSFRRWEAVFYLKKFGSDEVIDALVPLLDETMEQDVRVRSEVALALGRMGGSDEFPILLETLREDPSYSVRIRAAMALRSIGDASIVKELEGALASESDEDVKEFLVDAIEQASAR